MFTASSAQFFLSTKLSLVYKGTEKGTEVSEKVHTFFIAFERSLFIFGLVMGLNHGKQQSIGLDLAAPKMSLKSCTCVSFLPLAV